MKIQYYSKFTEQIVVFEIFIIPRVRSKSKWHWINAISIRILRNVHYKQIILITFETIKFLRVKYHFLSNLSRHSIVC